MFLRKILFWGLGLIFMTGLNAADVNKIISKVQDKYDKMKFLTAAFKQVETFKLTGSQTENTGKIYIADGNKYRFESEDQIVVTDGESVWTYNSISKQLLIDEVRENSGALIPRDLLFTYPQKYYATLLSESKENDKKIYLIRLDPKDQVYGYVKSLKIWVEDGEWLIHKIEATDVNGNKSLYEITNQDTKSKINDELFKFTPTEGVDVVDMR
ncbi:MAG: outer membrane lipoprotein chaperone LolA [Calditrichaceae bacterium]|nr:outer membrane lipoprotein chaperone LolA [Calditrichaceae bacterium]